MVGKTVSYQYYWKLLAIFGRRGCTNMHEQHKRRELQIHMYNNIMLAHTGLRRHCKASDDCKCCPTCTKAWRCFHECTTKVNDIRCCPTSTTTPWCAKVFYVLSTVLFARGVFGSTPKLPNAKKGASCEAFWPVHCVPSAVLTAWHTWQCAWQHRPVSKCCVSLGSVPGVFGVFG